MGEVVGVCEGGDEFELEGEARIGESGRRRLLLLLLFHCGLLDQLFDSWETRRRE